MKICPKCKSANVNINITPSAVFGAPQKWKCNDCGFEAYAVFPEAEIEEKAEKGNKKETKAKKKKVRK